MPKSGGAYRSHYSVMRSCCALALTVILAGCVTATPAEPPPMSKRPGPAPTAALLPWATNDAQLAAVAYTQLKNCLEERNLFRFVPLAQVQNALEQTGVNTNKAFGISGDDAKKVGDAVGADYVLSGTFSVVKTLKLNGWRKDVVSDLRIFRNADSKKLQTIKATTSFTFASAETDGRQMSQSAVNQLCSQALQYDY